MGNEKLTKVMNKHYLEKFFEELNVKIDINSIKLIGIFEAQAHGHPDGRIVKMTCYTANYFGKLIASFEIGSFDWLKYSDRNEISEVDKIIFDFLFHQNLIE